MDAVHTVLRKEEMRIQQRCLSESNVLPRSYAQPRQESDVGNVGDIFRERVLSMSLQEPVGPRCGGVQQGGGIWNAAARQARRQISHTPSNLLIFSP